MSCPKNKLRIVLIGAGRVATHLSARLASSFQLVQVYSRTMPSAESIATLYGAEAINDVRLICPDADVYLYALSDDALPAIIQQVAVRNTKGLHVHTAGSVGIDVFGDAVPRAGVLYPMQTFSKEKAIDWAEVPVFIEAKQPSDLATLQEIASALTPKVYEASSAQRQTLHLAAVFCCNFTNHLYAVAHRLLSEQGLPFEAMLPLIRETVQKVETLSPIDAQTGPAVREDQSILQRQHASLPDGSWEQQLYDLISQHIILYKKQS